VGLFLIELLRHQIHKLILDNLRSVAIKLEELRGCVRFKKHIFEVLSFTGSLTVDSLAGTIVHPAQVHSVCVPVVFIA
jgi:hypothetical protein